MSSKLDRARLTTTLLLFSALTPAAALAQAAQTTRPYAYTVDANGVNLADGTYVGTDTYVAIGSGPDRVSFDMMGQWGSRHAMNLHMIGSKMVAYGPDFTAKFFSPSSGGAWTNDHSDGTTMTQVSGSYVMTMRDGTRIIYGGAGQPGQNVMARATRMITPSGAVTDLTWSNVSYCAPTSQNPNGNPGCAQSDLRYSTRLESVGNSLGNKLTLNYSANAVTHGGMASAWERMTSVSGHHQPTSGPSSPMLTTNVNGSSYTDPLGRTTTITRTATSIRIRRPSSSTDNIVMTLDGAGRVTQVNRDGVTWRYAYTDLGQVLQTIISLGSSSRVIKVYKSLGMMESERDELSNTTLYEYSPTGRLTKKTLPERNYVQYEYDGRGNLTRAIAYPKSGGSTIVSSAGFEATCSNALTCNKPLWTSDAKGAVTNYSYDPQHGGVTLIKLPAAPNGVRPETRYTYGVFNGVWRLTGTATCRTTASCAGGADEVKTTVGYSVDALPTSVTTGAGDGSLTATAASTYNQYGNVLTTDGPLPGSGDITRYYYDAAQQLTGVVGPDPDDAGPRNRQAVRYDYNLDGQMRKVERGTAADQSDNALSTMTVLQSSVTTYDAAGRRASSALVAGGATHALTQFSYDGAGRLLCTARRMNPGAAAGTDACSLAPQGTFGPDRITRNGRDPIGRVTLRTTAYRTPDVRDEKIAYTANGRVSDLTDPATNVTRYYYDDFDRLATTNFQDGSIEQLTYDAAGNVITRRLRDGQVLRHSYDALNRRIHDDNPNTNVAEVDVSYEYDLLGRVTRAGDQNGWFAGFAYDALGRLTRQHSNLSSNALAYDAAGRLTRQTWADGFFVTYEYDNTDAMTAVRENGGFALASFGYDDLGRRTSLSRGNGTVTSYGYDAASRMNSLSQDLAGGAHDLGVTFGHNPAGQITSRSSSNDAYAFTGHYNVDRSYSANWLNQYTNVGQTYFSYDNRGNLTQSGSNSYAYNTRNQLFQNGAGHLFYRNPIGLLNHVIANGATTNMDHVGPDLATEFNGQTNQVLRRYVHGPGADEPLVWYEGSGTGDRRWLHADERGSVVAVTNGSGQAMAVNTYDEHGIPGAGNIGRFQYTGQKWVPELGMYDYKARMYSPTLGRFMQTDPIGYADGMNMYAYARGDAVNGIDPSGTETQEQCRSRVRVLYAGISPDNLGSSTGYMDPFQQCENLGFDRPVTGPEIVVTGSRGYIGPTITNISQLYLPAPANPMMASLILGSGPQSVTVGEGCAGVPAASDPAVQARALEALQRSVSGNSAGTAEYGFHVSEPYIGSGRHIGRTFTEGRQRSISGERIVRESPSPIANLITGYYPTTVFVHTHPNNDPPSPVGVNDRSLGQSVIAIDRAGTLTCAR